MAIPFGIVETVPDNETILDRESDVVHVHVGLPPRGLAEKAGGPKCLRETRPQNALKVREREPGVDDILDDDNVLAVERDIEVFLKADFTRAGCAFGIAR